MLDQTTMRAAVEELVGVDAAVQQAAVVSHDGLVMVTTDKDRDQAETAAAIVSELLNKGRLGVDELQLGAMHSQLVLGTNGGVLLRMITDEIVLSATVGKSVNVGRVMSAMNKISARLGQGF